MTLCPHTQKQCCCQPQEGKMCPYGPTPEDWRMWNRADAMAGSSFTCACGATFTRLDTLHVDLETGHAIYSRTWTPEDKCAACGGKYVEVGKIPESRVLWKPPRVH